MKQEEAAAQEMGTMEAQDTATGRPSGRKPREPKRLNRLAPAGEAASRLLDPALKRRGFATRDLLAHWKAMAPAPYDKLALPDRLAWPRGARGSEGAVLYLRCAPGHALALAHEGAMIAAAINRYFGYLLVGQVRLSAAPFSPGSSPRKRMAAEPDPAALAHIESLVAPLADDELRNALAALGRSVAARSARR